MEHVWQKIELLRADHELLQEDKTPIDVFAFLEIDLGLDPIPFDDLCAKYRVEAAIKADFTGIYLDAEQYKQMEKGPDWKLNRLRFTVAHELAHYFLHRDLPQAQHFASLPEFAKWNQTHGGRKYTIEQEANEFAGRLLVPESRLRACFDEFALQMENLLPNFMASGSVRDKFADKVAPASVSIPRSSPSASIATPSGPPLSGPGKLPLPVAVGNNPGHAPVAFRPNNPSPFPHRRTPDAQCERKEWPLPWFVSAATADLAGNRR